MVAIVVAAGLLPPPLTAAILILYVVTELLQVLQSVYILLSSLLTRKVLGS